MRWGVHWALNSVKRIVLFWGLGLGELVPNFNLDLHWQCFCVTKTEVAQCCFSTSVAHPHPLPSKSQQCRDQIEEQHGATCSEEQIDQVVNTTEKKKKKQQNCIEALEAFEVSEIFVCCQDPHKGKAHKYRGCCGQPLVYASHCTFSLADRMIEPPAYLFFK